MKPYIRLVLALVLLIASPVALTRAAEPALEGTYAAQGFNPDGSEYRGVVKITRHGDSVMVAWLFPRVVGEDEALVLRAAGVGVVHGGMLAVSYYGQDATGIALYQIENDGQRLSGRWVAANSEGEVQLETLTKLR
jgi:hypothetical protein